MKTVRGFLVTLLVLTFAFSPVLPFLTTSIALARPAGLSITVQREFDATSLDNVDMSVRCDGGTWQDVGFTTGGFMTVAAAPMSGALSASSGSCGDGSSVDFSATLDGYVTHEIDSAFTISFSSPQPVSNLVDWFNFNYPNIQFTSSDALLFSHTITVKDADTSDPITGATIDAGSATCVEEGSGIYLCPITLSNDGATVSVSAAGYTTGTISTGDRGLNTDLQSSDAGVLSLAGSGATAPGAPTDLQQVGLTSSSVTLFWNSPADTGGSALTDFIPEYSIHHADPNDDSWTVFQDGVGVETNTATVTGLSPSTDYDFRLSAVNIAGTGLPSSIFEVATLAAMSISFVSPTPADSSTVSDRQFEIKMDSAAEDSNHYAFTDFNHSVLSWFRFENSAHTSIGSASGVFNGTEAYTTGRFGRAAVLNGSDSYIDVPLSSAVSNHFTLSAWVYLNDRSAGQALFSDANGHLIQIGGGGQWQFDNYAASPVADMGTWTHVVGVYDNGTETLYIDGVSAASGGGNRVLQQDVNIGRRMDGVYLNANVDDVLIFNRALSSAEVSSLYNATSTQYDATFSSLPDDNSYTFTGYAVDVDNNEVETAERSVLVDATPTDTAISSCADFENINNDLDGIYHLTADLSCAGEGNNIMVGGGAPFTGTFNGNGHTITIALSDPNGNNTDLGLFQTTVGATIQNVTVSGVIDGEHEMGALVSNANSTHFDNVHVIITLTVDENNNGGSAVGGLIGYLGNNSILEHSYATGSVMGLDSSVFLGGLVGAVYSSQILLSYATDTVTSNSTNLGCGVGGLVGCLIDGSDVEQSFATGAVSAQNSAGGFVGGMWQSTVLNSYATGNVSGDNGIGGFVGWIETAQISMSYASGSVTGDDGANGGGGQEGGFGGYASGSQIDHDFSTGLVSHGIAPYGGFIGQDQGGNTFDYNFYDQTTSDQTSCTSDGDVAGCTGVDTSGAPDANYFNGNTTNPPFDHQWDFTTTPIWDTVTAHVPILHAFSREIQSVSLFNDGDGSSENPYQITTCTQLQAMNTSLSSHYILENNIDCSDTASWNANSAEWVDGVVGGTLIPDSYGSVTHTDIVVVNNGYFGFSPVGDGNIAFTGTFDGNNKTISHLWIFRKESNFNGVFGITSGSTIQNLTIADSNIVGGNYTGGVVGYVDAGTVTHVNLSNNMVRTYLAYYGGGLAGEATDNATISYIVNTGGVVHGSGDVIGGLIGAMYTSTLDHSSSSADVDGGWEIGGIVGDAETVTITNCFASGGTITSNRSEYVRVKTGYNAGGFAGYLNDAMVSDSYATDVVHSSGYYAGGFAGSAYNSTITNAYATGDVTANEEIIGDSTFDPSYIGGFAGQIVLSVLNKTFASGNVSSPGSQVGGYAGSLYQNTLYDAYAAGAVSGNQTVGGFAGETIQYNDIQRVYARGAVTGIDTPTTGALVGVDDASGTLTNSFWDNQTSAQSVSAGGTGATTADMKKAVTFTGAGWDFETIWGIDAAFNGGYPTFVFYHAADTTPPATPVASPVAGTYTSTQSVTLAASGSDSIRYATTDTLTDCTSGTLYSGAISVGVSETIYVRACKSSNTTHATASFVYTIAAPVVSGGGGGGGGHPYTPPAPAINSAPVVQTPVAVPLTTPQTIRTSPVTNAGLPPGFQFKKDLKPLSTKSDIKNLQIFLNNNGFLVAKTGAGSKGKENTYFNLKTKQALIRFQEAHAKDILIPQGLKKGTGILGPYTRKVINAWLANASQ